MADAEHGVVGATTEDVDVVADHSIVAACASDRWSCRLRRHRCRRRSCSRRPRWIRCRGHALPSRSRSRQAVSPRPLRQSRSHGSPSPALRRLSRSPATGWRWRDSRPRGLRAKKARWSVCSRSKLRSLGERAGRGEVPTVASAEAPTAVALSRVAVRWQLLSSCRYQQTNCGRAPSRWRRRRTNSCRAVVWSASASRCDRGRRISAVSNEVLAEGGGLVGSGLRVLTNSRRIVTVRIRAFAER